MKERPRERRPRPRESEPTITPKEDQESTPAVAAEPSPSDAAPERVSFYIGADGAPMWDRMHAGTKEKIERLVGRAPGGGAAGLNPAVSKALAGAVVASVPVFLQIGLRLLGYTPESVSNVKLAPATVAELTPLYAAALADYQVALGRHENLIVALGMTGLALAPAFEKLERVKKPNGSAGGPLLDMMRAEERPAS